MIICLNSLSINAEAMNLIATPEDAPRLFDLVTPSDPRYATAFYSILKDTLVATDLAQANRIAFGGKKRWRVVTLDGKLVDISGTMSGGGNRVSRGAMSSKLQADDVTPEVVAKLERERETAEHELKVFVEDRETVEQELMTLKKRLPELDMALTKAEMDARGSVQRIEETEKRIQELKCV